MNLFELWSGVLVFGGMIILLVIGGEVCRKKDGVVLKQYVQKNGYAAVFLKKDNWTSAVLVHRLVAMAFLPTVRGKDFVDHINTVRSDNRVENLRWVDAKENANNAITLCKRHRF